MPEAGRQILVRGPVMVRVHGHHKLPPPQAHQVVLAQDATDTFVIHHPALLDGVA
jgi:hypothetical protein